MSCSHGVFAEGQLSSGNHRSKGLKHLHNVETGFCCPQAFLSVDFQCRDDVSELK